MDPEVWLSRGIHRRREDGLNAMEYVALLAGEPHSHQPLTASLVLSAFINPLNDLLDDELRQRLKAFAPRLIGSSARAEEDELRGWLLADWAVRQYLPELLLMARLQPLDAIVRAVAELGPDSGEPHLALLQHTRNEALARELELLLGGARPEPRRVRELLRMVPVGAVIKAIGVRRWSGRLDALWETTWEVARSAARVAVALGTEHSDRGEPPRHLIGSAFFLLERLVAPSSVRALPAIRSRTAILRIDCRLGVELRHPQLGQLEGTVENLSLAGAMVLAHASLAPRSRVWLRLRLEPDEAPIECEGEVVWSVSDCLARSTALGLVFVEPSDRTTQRLRGFLRRQALRAAGAA